MLPPSREALAPHIMERNQTSLHQKQLDGQVLTRAMNTIPSITMHIHKDKNERWFLFTSLSEPQFRGCDEVD